MLSVVRYNGERPWLGPTAAYDLVEPLPGTSVPADLLSFELIELRRLCATELEGVASPVAALFRLERCEEPGQYLPVSSDLAAIVSGRENQELHDAFVTFINEVVFRRLTPPGSEPPRISRLVEVPSMLEQRIDRWNMKQQELGRREGRREGGADVVLRLLERKFGPLSAWVKKRVNSADAAQLLVWADRILTAATLDEIFAE